MVILNVSYTNPLGNYLTTQSNPDGVDYQDLAINQVCSSSAPTFFCCILQHFFRDTYIRYIHFLLMILSVNNVSLDANQKKSQQITS